MLRDYQQKTLTMLYDWMENNTGNPCVELPTGSGKSHVIAALCKDLMKKRSDTRILMLTHVKELIEQNAEKMRLHWPGAPMGIYSASVGRKESDEPITFAGIQSIYKKAALFGRVDFIICDECFVAGTKISTPKGQVDIDKVRCGDLVFNARGVGTVEAVSCRSVLETLLVELDDGNKFECTRNHPIFTDKGWEKAEQLEIGAYLFRIEGVSSLWSSIQTLDQKGRQRKSDFSHVGTVLEKAELLLREVCKEITPDGSECRSTQTNAGNFEKNQASTYSTWRKRAIAAFATASTASCVGGRMDSRVCNQDQSGAFERDIPKYLQGRHLLSGKDDLHRIGWGESRHRREKNAGQKERSVSRWPRVARISRIKRESPTLVFNIQVSGHPSYFANGIAAHNCHLISHKAEGSYRSFIGSLLKANPDLRVIGLSATTYRLGHGLITEKPAIFDVILKPTSIEELIDQGHLSKLRSKDTLVKIDVAGVGKRGGEYIEAELQEKVDKKEQNAKIASEVIARAGDRKTWIFFCTGVKHAEHMAEELRLQGIAAECLTGETKAKDRESIIQRFKSGELKALTNANVLTTGFDCPDIDLVVLMRPTMSPGLYMQQVGRGMRLKSHTDHCLVLDFAGVVSYHGPVTKVQPPKKAGKGNGEAPVKLCDNCSEICHAAVRVCPCCDYQFPPPKEKELFLHGDCIMGIENSQAFIEKWSFQPHMTVKNIECILVKYFLKGKKTPLPEYLLVYHPGWVGQDANRTLRTIASKTIGMEQLDACQTISEVVRVMNKAKCPAVIEYKAAGKYPKITERLWYGTSNI